MKTQAEGEKADGLHFQGKHLAVKLNADQMDKRTFLCSINIQSSTKNVCSASAALALGQKQPEPFHAYNTPVSTIQQRISEPAGSFSQLPKGLTREYVLQKSFSEVRQASRHCMAMPFILGVLKLHQ